MRTYFDPPSDPFSSSHECPECDQDLEKDLVGEWVCKNPDCKNSFAFVPFLVAPNLVEFRYVNDGKGVCIRFYETDASFEEITFLRKEIIHKKEKEAGYPYIGNNILDTQRR